MAWLRHAACLVIAIAGLCVAPSWAASPDTAAPGRVEAVLAIEHRQDLEAIKREWAEAGLLNLHVQFMKAGHPPTNIGLGPSVTAERARAAIRLAKKYNRDVTILLPERLFPDHYVTIASSSFDDTVEYPVSEEQLKELENPALNTEQFHDLYRRLTPADQPPVKKGRVF